MRVEKVECKELVMDPANARVHPEKNLEAIKGSLSKFGQQKPIVVNRDGVVLAGNGTLAAARDLGWEKIDVVRTKLTGADATAYALADNRTTDMSEWDDDALGSLLQSLYEDDYPIDEIGFDPGDWAWGDSSDDDVEAGEAKYTDKIEAPVYEPKGDKPELVELVDLAKRDELNKKINAAKKVPAEVKKFLIQAAERHVVFDYEKVAEYYAHAPKEVQELMEESALVIIDFDKAIEGGFVRMSKTIASMYNDAEPEDA